MEAEDSTHCGRDNSPSGDDPKVEDRLTAGDSLGCVRDEHLDLHCDDHASDGHSDEDSPYVWDGQSVEDDHHIGSNVQVSNTRYEEGLRLGLSIGADNSAQAFAMIRRGMKQSDLWTFYKLEVFNGPSK